MQYDTLRNELYTEGRFCYPCSGLSFAVFPSVYLGRREHLFKCSKIFMKFSSTSYKHPFLDFMFIGPCIILIVE